VISMSKPAPARMRSKTKSTNPTFADIAARAFELYCERGRQDGYDVEHWLQAERELQETAKSSAA
jgi:hypothetical protein